VLRRNSLRLFLTILIASWRVLRCKVKRGIGMSKQKSTP